MLQDMNNKDNNKFTFIQEQIASKRKGKIKKMIFSFLWTIVLAGIFGIVAAFSFHFFEPEAEKLLGKEDGKKQVEFPTAALDGNNQVVISGEKPGQTGDTSTVFSEITNGVTNTREPKIEVVKEQKEPETVIIEQRVDGNLEDLENIYSELKRINNSYFRSLVTVTSITSNVDWHNDEIDYSTVTTGLILAENGADILILVNYDKIKDAKSIEVGLWDTASFDGRIQAFDEELNIAIVAVVMDELTKEQVSGIAYAELGESYNISLGEPILALGAPNGYVGSMGFGIISTKLSSRYVTDGKIDIFHTDIMSNENSEGFIVDLNGSVIGIIANSFGDNVNSNVTTAIGMSKIKKVIQSLVNETERSYMGIKVLDMPDDIIKEYGITSGIYILEVLPSSPALEAGLQIGDIITSIEDTSVLSVQAFQNMLNNYETKQVVGVKVYRTSKSTEHIMEFDLTIGRKKGS